MQGPRDRLLSWYRGRARILPWREDPSPYHVLVSEVMLQQTRVETVLQRWDAFLHHFPDLASLANATEAEVMATWSGLGYYNRARRLHAAAKEIHAQGWPTDTASLRRLPGFGDYTAAAVGSIAFGWPGLAMDGNVLRWMNRFTGTPRDRPLKPSDATAFRKQFQPWLEDLEDPGLLTQAMIELGALICKPRQAHCHVCPLASNCVSNDLGLTEVLPMKADRKPKPIEHVPLAWHRRGDTFAVIPGPQEGLLAGLLQLPPLEDEDAELLGVIEHHFTHRHWFLAVHKVAKPPAQAQWMSYEEFLASPHSTAMRKAVDLALNGKP